MTEPSFGEGLPSPILDCNPVPDGEAETAAFGYPSQAPVFLNSGSERTFGYPRHAPSYVNGELRSRALKSPRMFLFRVRVPEAVKK